jgi:DNA-binding NarL/FixJ family response regulator
VIKLLLVDSHVYYRRALHQLCAINGGFNVVAEADNGELAVSLARQFRPDVVLMDAELPGLSGLEAAQQLTSESPTLRVLLLTLFDAPRLRTDAHDMGVCAVLRKDCDESVLFSAICAAHASHQSPAS